MYSPSRGPWLTQKCPVPQGAEIWGVLDPRGQPHLMPKGVVRRNSEVRCSP